MILILILALISGISAFLALPENLSQVSVTLHHICLRSLPNTVENLSSLEALVCGKNMQELQLKDLLIQSSLIHIFVVSGSHFIFLRKILAALPFVRKYPLLILSAYALVTLAQPPSVRALMFLVLVEISEQKKLFLSAVILVFLSSCLSIAVFPQWFYSRSLIMSMMAALVLAVMSDFWGKEKSSIPALFLTQSALYLAMGFCLWGFSNLHPLSILLNIILGPLIGTLLFPLGFIVVLVPPLGFLFDFSMNALIWILEKQTEVLGVKSQTSPLGFYWQWILFFTLLIFSYHYLIFKKRQKAVRD